MNMRIGGTSFAMPTPETSTIGSTPTAPGGAEGLFTRLIEDGLTETTSQHVHANESLRELALGQSDNLHQVMLRMAQADLSFRFLLEVRNRLTEAYQEIMRMQV